MAMWVDASFSNLFGALNGYARTDEEISLSAGSMSDYLVTQIDLASGYDNILYAPAIGGWHDYNVAITLTGGAAISSITKSWNYYDAGFILGEHIALLGFGDTYVSFRVYAMLGEPEATDSYSFGFSGYGLQDI